jgi:hypothetical protein
MCCDYMFSDRAAGVAEANISEGCQANKDEDHSTFESARALRILLFESTR